jgi:hypothetical protein
VPRKQLSDKPAAVRARMKRNAGKVSRDVEILYQKPISDWDMEELARGRPRNSAGNFTGPRPTWLTPLIMKESQDRLRTLTRQELSTYAGDAVRVMAELMNEDGTDLDGKPLVAPTVRLQAATYVMDQIIGKSTTPIELTGNVVLQTLMADVVVNDESGTVAHPVIEGTVVEVDPEEENEGGE